MMIFYLLVLSSVMLNMNWYTFYMTVSVIFFFFLFFFPFCYNSDTALGFLNESFSFSMLYLSLFIILLMVSASNSVYKYKVSELVFISLLIFLLMSLIFSFSVKSSLMFYFFFEVSLVPTLLLIMGWGYQVERIQASMYFLLYTMFSSLPLLLSLLFIMQSEGLFILQSTFVNTIKITSICVLNYMSLWFMFGAFLVKLPMYLFHLWLPKAHVEAPVSGSMILAGVLLKLGGYGVIRFTLIVKSVLKYSSSFLVSLSLVSMFFVGVICFRSNDLKSLVAYSSISHMGMGMAGLFTMNTLGMKGGILMLIGHGICSSGLFSMINMIYERVGSRSMFMGKGLMNLIVSISLFSFLLSVSNMAAPPTMNLFSEIMLMISVISFSNSALVLLVMGSFLVASYSITFFSYTNQGKSYSNSYCYGSLGLVEYLTLYLHSLVLIFSFFLVNLLL